MHCKKWENGREPKSCLNRVVNSKLGRFGTIHDILKKLKPGREKMAFFDQDVFDDDIKTKDKGVSDFIPMIANNQDRKF
jgi:hypothetical protein